jgi:phage replication-related protein YjqB (UPF0714/DUF867 family)
MATNIRTFEATTTKAREDQEILTKFEEHCGANAQQLTSIGLSFGQQARVHAQGQEAFLFTVNKVRPPLTPKMLSMGAKARQRIGIGDAEKVIVSNRVPHPKLSDDGAKAEGEFIERLRNRPSEDKLVVIAPHGGDIEIWTDKQAERVADLLKVTCWRCRGYQAPRGAGALRRWHITSTDIHEASFPLLGKIIDRGFANAVSFHGFSRKDEEETAADIIIGGGAGRPLKRLIREALKKALPSAFVVQLAPPGSPLEGRQASNIVNRLALNRNGVQLEQSRRVREQHWQAIANAVADVYRDHSVAD